MRIMIAQRGCTITVLPGGLGKVCRHAPLWRGDLSPLGCGAALLIYQQINIVDL
jgi:hypothetical protein